MVHYFQTAQKLGVQRDDHRRRAHGNRTDAHRQVDSPADEEPCCDRDGDQIVGRRPDQILDPARDNSIAPTTSRGSLRTSTIPADSTATSVPAPIAIPTSAVASAGASFTPSATIATFLPPAWNRATAEALSVGLSHPSLDLRWAPASFVLVRAGPRATGCRESHPNWLRAVDRGPIALGL